MTPQTPRPGMPPTPGPRQAAPTPPGGTADDPAAASPSAAGSRTPAPVKPIDVGVALHTRWHINRGITNPDCEHCKGRIDLGTCRECGAPLQRRRHRRGYCRCCYARWWNAGCPEDGPPPPRSPNRDLSAAIAAWRERSAGRREDYFWLRDELRLTREQAAARIGVCQRTAERYEAKRRRELAA